MPRLILASASPRRASVLTRLGLDFEVRPADIDESARPGEGAPDLAERLARAKAATAVEPGALALGFDTVVSHAGEILGKPGSEAEARRMLARLGGDAHDVYSGVAIAVPGRIESAAERTRVRFRPLGPDEPAAYVATGEPMDKAGAYGIQGAGAALVARVEGDFFNVMGFPVQRFQELLIRLGWRYAFGAVESLPG